ncbi:TolC family protein [Colwellia asteriadis]|uniref:TolC family protein n=1 Tax=Colwellia asteriadis TaxID=517723 RepID=A0ABN1L487_9GAMM
MFAIFFTKHQTASQAMAKQQTIKHNNAVYSSPYYSTCLTVITFVFIVFCAFIFISSASAATLATANNSNTAIKTLSLQHAINYAQQNDPWLKGNQHQQQAIESLSNAAATLPDPKMSLGLNNLPTDGFDFSQEGMTQVKVGISQMFARGDSLAIKKQQLHLSSEAYPYLRQDRSAQVAVTVGSLWLDAFKAQQSIALIEKNRALFDQLTDIAQINYASTAGKTRQQDIIRAQLELTRLEERLDTFAGQQSKYHGMMSPWLTPFEVESLATQPNVAFEQQGMFTLSSTLPDISLLKPELVQSKQWLSATQLAQQFANHPAVFALNKKIASNKTGISLAEQAYKPEWGVNASYGYRDDTPSGASRSDFFSVGVTFDLPLFTENKQNMAVKSAISQTESVKTEKILLLRQLIASFNSAKGRFLRIQTRKSLYQTQLLPQIHDQAEAALSAYTNDDGDFAEVVRARIAVLNAEIDHINLLVEEQKLILALNYLFIAQKTSVTNQPSLAALGENS